MGSAIRNIRLLDLARFEHNFTAISIDSFLYRPFINGLEDYNEDHMIKAMVTEDRRYTSEGMREYPGVHCLLLEASAEAKVIEEGLPNRT